MVDTSVNDTTGNPQKPTACATVLLLSAVRANVTGLAGYDNGKKLSQSRVRQLFPTVSGTILQQRCRTTMCNWRFHNAVKKIDFESDEESVEAQCRAVLKEHPQAGINTFLLEPEHISMVSRVQDALSANASGKETLKDWKMVSTWACDAAVNDGSGIVFPPNWVNSADSFKFANFFVTMYADVLNNTLPKGFFDGVPAGAVRGQWVPKNSSQREKENSVPRVCNPQAAARVFKDKSQSKGKKLNDEAIYDLVQTRHCFNFSTFDGPTDPVVPEECEQQESHVKGKPDESEGIKRSSPCPSEEENDEHKENEPDEKRARSSSEADLCSAINLNLLLADRDNERGACSAPADTQKPAEDIVCSVVEQKAAEATTAVPSGLEKRDSALKASSAPTEKGTEAKAGVSTVPAGSQSKHKSGASTEGEDRKVAVAEQKAEPSAAKTSKGERKKHTAPKTKSSVKSMDTSKHDSPAAADDNDVEMQHPDNDMKDFSAPTAKLTSTASKARSSVQSMDSDMKDSPAPSEAPQEENKTHGKGPVAAKDLIKAPAAKKAKKQMSLFSFAKKTSPTSAQPNLNATTPFGERTNTVAEATAK